MRKYSILSHAPFILLVVFHLLKKTVLIKPQGDKPHEDRGIPGCLEKMTEASRAEVLLGRCSLARWIANLSSSSPPYFTLPFPFFLSFYFPSLYPSFLPSSLALSFISNIAFFHHAEFSLIKVSSLIKQWFLFPSYGASKYRRQK